MNLNDHISGWGAFERRGNNAKGYEDFRPKVQAMIWPCLSYVWHIRSTADVTVLGTIGRVWKICVFCDLLSGYGGHLKASFHALHECLAHTKPQRPRTLQ